LFTLKEARRKPLRTAAWGKNRRRARTAATAGRLFVQVFKSFIEK
jgi:hypothetical protein